MPLRTAAGTDPALIPPAPAALPSAPALLNTGENCFLRRCVVDENASIGNNVQVGGQDPRAANGKG